MCTHCKHPTAKPLTAEEVKELQDEDCGELVVQLNGQSYNSEDLYHCDNHKECGFKTADYHDLDDDGLCEGCAEGAREYAAYVEDVNWTYWHSVL